MIISANDRQVWIDTGRGLVNEVLHRKEGCVWRIYEIEGKPVTRPLDYHDLPPGTYKMIPIQEVSE